MPAAFRDALSWAVMHIPARTRDQGRHKRIEIEIAKPWKERIAMLRRNLQHRLDHRVSKIAAASLSSTGLRNIENQCA